ARSVYRLIAAGFRRRGCWLLAGACEHGATSALAVNQAVAIRVTISGTQLTPLPAMGRIACSVSAGGQMPRQRSRAARAVDGTRGTHDDTPIQAILRTVLK